MNLQFSLLYRCSFLTLAAIGLVLILKKSQLHHGKTGNSWAALPQKKKFNEWVTSITLLSGISRGELLIEFVGKVPEFIEFTSNDLTIYNEFGFSPKITLDEGISKHFDWIMREHNFD